MTDAKAKPHFDADWWPLEMAIAWLATGRHRVAALAADMALKRRLGERQLPLGLWLSIRHGLASHETVHGSLFRSEARGPEFQSKPVSKSRLYVVPSGDRFLTYDGISDSNGVPLPPGGELWITEPARTALAPLQWAMSNAVRLMWHRPAWGCTEGERKPIPPDLW